MQQELAQVLFSLNAGQQAAALLRSEVANDGYYKVGGGVGRAEGGLLLHGTHCCMALIPASPWLPPRDQPPWLRMTTGLPLTAGAIRASARPGGGTASLLAGGTAEGCKLSGLR